MALIQVEGTDVVVESNEGEPILTTFMRCGYSYIVGCKRGGCGICKLGIVEGVVQYPVTVADTVLPEADRTTIALSCRAVPAGNITLEIQPGTKFRAISPYFAKLAKAAAQAVAAAAAATAAATEVALAAPSASSGDTADGQTDARPDDKPDVVAEAGDTKKPD